MSHGRILGFTLAISVLIPLGSLSVADARHVEPGWQRRYVVKYSGRWPNCENVACFDQRTVVQMHQACDESAGFFGVGTCTGFTFEQNATVSGGCLKACGDVEFGGFSDGAYDYFAAVGDEERIDLGREAGRPRRHVVKTVHSPAQSNLELFRRYVRLHRKASAEPISSDRSYWIFHAGREGFGNRMRALISLLLVCLTLDKMLYIVWDEPVHHSHLLNSEVSFDAAPHLDRLTAHFGKANVSICIPCTNEGHDCANNLALEIVGSLDQQPIMWTAEFAQARTQLCKIKLKSGFQCRNQNYQYE